MPQATILIVTRNRREVAKNSVQSAISQAGDNQVLVIDDGSTDGTAEYLRGLFPQVSIVQYPDARGCIVRRNQGCQLAEGPIVFSIDDDAEYTDPDVVNDTLKVFDEPRAAGVMIPHINYSVQREASWHAPIAPDDGQTYATHAFIGTAYALRKDLFNRLGGYHGILVHWGEETDFCQRLLDSGHVVIMGSKYRINHFPHLPGKYQRSNLLYIYRNRVLTLWFNTPPLLLAPMMLAELARSAVKAPGTNWVSAQGALMGLAEITRSWRLRKAVSLQAFMLYFKLRKHKMIPLAELRATLPAVSAAVPTLSTKAGAEISA